MLTTIFMKLLENSIQTSFFILAIMFIRLCFRRLPKRYVCILWGLVALRLICPFEITSPFSLVPDTGHVQTWVEQEVTLPQDIGENSSKPNVIQPDRVIINNQTTNNTIHSEIATDAEKIDDISSGTETGETVGSSPSHNNTAMTAPTSPNLPFLLSSIWCVGMLFLLGYSIISYIRTKWFLREAVHDTDNIWYCDIPSPFVMGYVKPRIYIPFSVEQTDLPYIVAHEKTHIAYFDHFGKLLGYFLLCVYWFNPFIWGAYIYYCKDLELACDERVILQLGDAERKPYSQALLACSVTNKSLLQSPLAFSEAAIKERILHILNYKKLGFWGILAAILACIVAALCFLTSPAQPKNNQTNETTEFSDVQEPIAYYADYIEMLESLRKDFSVLSKEDKVFYSCPSGDFPYITALNEISDISLYFYSLKEDMNYVIGKSSLTLKRTNEGYDIYEKELVLLNNIATADEYIGYPILYFHSDLLGVMEANHAELGSSEVPLKELIIAHYCKDGRYTELEDDFALFAPDTALEALLPLDGGLMEVLPAEDDLHKLVRYTFADSTQLTFTMETDGPISSIGGKAFWFPKNGVYTSPQNALEAKKTEIFTLQATVEDLRSAIEGFSDATDYLYTLPDVYSPNLFCKVAETSDGNVILYGLRNCNALILQDDDKLYPIFMRWYLNRGILPEVYKSDYDGDGEAEYAIYSLENSGSESQIMRLTILEVVDDSLEMEIFDNSKLSNWMRYTDDTGTKLDCGHFISFEERNGQWWVRTSVRVMTEGTSISGGTDNIYLEAPLTYYDHHMNSNRYFDIGKVSMIGALDESPQSQITYTENTLTIYKDQLAAFPGTCSIDEKGNLVTSFNVTDYECAVTTSSITGETVYHWYLQTHFRPTSKAYPLEIKNEKVQEVPARIVTEKELLEYTFGEALIHTTYQAYPRGIKQYILRENGTINVNIGYESDTFLNLQYLTFEISEDKQTATLTDNGFGYYLLQANDVSGLKAFRDAFTGNEHLIPNDSTQLPWKWLITMNGEEYYKPQLNATDVPTIEHRYDFEYIPSYNLSDFYHGFYASESSVDGASYTEFHYQDGTDNIILLTDNGQKVISITFNGQKIALPEQTLLLYHGAGGSYGIPYYMDVTGDGVKELVFEGGYRTTNECYVYDATSMKNYPFETDGSAIASMLDISLGQFMISEKDSNICFEISNGDEKVTHEISFNKTAEFYPNLIAAGLTPEGINEYFNCRLTPEIQHISYQQEKQCFEATLYIVVDHVIPDTISGVVRVNYIWNDDRKMFTLDLDSVQLRAQ